MPNRILLVDDEMDVMGIEKELLECLGYQVTGTTSSQEAIVCFRRDPSRYDLVITDYNMPEMDGKQLTEYIRQQSWQADVPVLMVTSEQNQGRLAAVERAGVSAVCDKPFEASSIRRLISDALRR